jgi:hypothetical protein
MTPLVLPRPDGRRDRFRRYARAHFTALVERPDPAVRVRPARRRVAGRPADLVRLARLARLTGGTGAAA